ncbi:MULTISPECIES: MauE/DoxX family redox-associated membrane protein [Limnospira]|uniref:Methylamine utilisation protein MauE domain-containing protein n=2 Tax=Limnospira TaxID=2596745 RepID=A0A9P1KDH1_9CYAN|nr:MULTISPECIES: MauE/DoxX family redox-associated membrane protein [Limnospira]EDZ92506.1 conserved hypothetical protein [Limnospira maxima CS-328]MDC0836620.1 hypothetical protein [Limnoraphis robusta]MDT9232363.1 hypothetical protein [Limnospira sp. PMC 917.15]CDM94551.1 conserved hypothetical protein [Limnospira indica PCC 8005]
MISATLANFGIVFVGSVFLLTAIAKISEPWKFAQHIAQLRLFTSGLIEPITITFIAVEATIGTALIFGATPAIMIPFSIIILMGLSWLTYWSTSTGKTEDCGCYNGWLKITPNQSLLLNLLYIIFLGVGLIGNYNTGTILWRWMIVIATFLVSYTAASASLAYLDIHGYPFLDLAPIQANRPWQNQWLGEAVDLDLSLGSKLIVFMSPRCPQCKDWLQVLKIVHDCPELPDVLGVVAFTNYDEMRWFVDSYQLNFSVVALDSVAYDRLKIDTVPTAVIVEDGIIREKWVAGMPASFVQRIKQALSVA